MQEFKGRKGLILLFGATVLTLLASSLASAQVDTGAILGTIEDPSGAVVPGAQVTIIDNGTGLTVSTTTSSLGSYIFTPVKIGTYTVTAQATGFEKTSQSNIVVHVQAQVKVDLTLHPGRVTTTVQVTNAPPELQTQDASTGEVVSGRLVNNLPLISRNYTFLAQLSAGVTANATSGGGRFNATGGIVSNGLGAELNNYILDGVDNNDDEVDFLAGTAYVNLTPPDAIQEFKTQTSDFSAEFGRAGGAVINATTKSGTNHLHGDLWEYVQNDDLNAASWGSNRVSQAKTYSNENTFGFTIGGPVVLPHIYNGHNKTFFFGDFQEIRIDNHALDTSDVPTTPEVSSGYTNYQDQFGVTTTENDIDYLGREFNSNSILDPATTRPVTAGQVDPVTGLTAIQTGYVRDPFYTCGSITGMTNFTTSAAENCMNILPATRLDPNAIKLLQLFPAQNLPIALSAPGSNGTSSNYAVTRAEPDNTAHFDVRLDHNFSAVDQLFGRVSYDNRSAFYPGGLVGLASNAGFGDGYITNISLNTMLSETHTFSPSLINELRIGFSRLHTVSNASLVNTPGVPAEFGIQGIPQYDGNYGLPTMSISGLSQLGAGEYAWPNWRFSNTWQLNENITKVLPHHTFKGGFEGQFIRFPWNDPTYPRGDFNFGTYTGIPNGCVAGTGLAGEPACSQQSQGGLGVADLLLTPIASTVPGGIDYVGGPSSMSASNDTEIDDVRHYYGAYFQDAWKITHRLTLNLGLRYEFFGQIRERYGADAIMDPGVYTSQNNELPPKTGQNTVSGAQYIINCASKNVALSPSFTSQLATEGIALTYSCQPGLMSSPLTDFSPRGGVAWQVTNKLVARMGYGIFFGGFQSIGGDPDPGFNYPFFTSLNNPNTTNYEPITFPDGQHATLERGLLDMEPTPNSPNFSAEGLSFESYQPNWKTGYTQEWNGSLQYALNPSQTVTVGYVANTSRHLMNDMKRNQPDVLLGKPLPNGYSGADYDPWPEFSNDVDYVASDGDAYYWSFQGTYQKRVSRGVEALADYTYSRCMNDLRNILGSFGDTFWDRLGGGVLPGYSIKNEYHFCGSDVPNLIHVSGTWQLPIGRGEYLGRNMNRVANAFVGGWSTQGIWTFESGFPFELGCTAVPISNPSAQTCNPDLVPGQPLYLHSGPDGGINEFLNPYAFTNPPSCIAPAGSTDAIGCTNGITVLGGRTFQAHAPTQDAINFSIFKAFRTTDRTQLQFRAEFYNILNHTTFGAPGNFNWTSAEEDIAAGKPFTFANITGTGPAYIPREIQFAMKFYF